MSPSVIYESPSSLSLNDAAGKFGNGETDLNNFEDMELINAPRSTHDQFQADYISAVSNNGNCNEGHIDVQQGRQKRRRVSSGDSDSHLYTPISVPPPHHVSCTPSPIDNHLWDETSIISLGTVLDSIDDEMDHVNELNEFDWFTSPTSDGAQVHDRSIFNNSVPTNIKPEQEKLIVNRDTCICEEPCNLKMKIFPASLTTKKGCTTDITKQESAYPETGYVPNDYEEHHRQNNIKAHMALVSSAAKKIDSQLEALSSLLSDATDTHPSGICDTRTIQDEKTCNLKRSLQECYTPCNIFWSGNLPRDQQEDFYNRFVSFKNAMSKSKVSHNNLVSWDRKQGMKSSHSKTMTASKHSRKTAFQFVTVRIRKEEKARKKNNQ